MILGHLMLAFALGVLGAARFGRSKRTAMYIGLLAGAFATLPDIDILFATDATVRVVLAQAPVDATGNGVFTGTVHRGLTHTLPLASLSVAFAYFVHRTTSRAASRRARFLTGIVAIGVFSSLLGLATASDGLRGTLVVGVFVLGAGTLAIIARRLGLSSRAVAVTGLLGTCSHPFGDVFVGQPPAILYPLVPGVTLPRVVLLSDPTLNFLGMMLIELACIWAALYAVFHLSADSATLDKSVSILGTGYGSVVLFITPPTVDSPHLFVYALLGLALITASLSVRKGSVLQSLVTGTTTVTLGVLAYAAMYVGMYVA